MEGIHISSCGVGKIWLTFQVLFCVPENSTNRKQIEDWKFSMERVGPFKIGMDLGAPGAPECCSF